MILQLHGPAGEVELARRRWVEFDLDQDAATFSWWLLQLRRLVGNRAGQESMPLDTAHVSRFIHLAPVAAASLIDQLTAPAKPVKTKHVTFATADNLLMAEVDDLLLEECDDLL